MNKIKLFLTAALASASVAFAGIADEVETAATSMTTDLNAIVGHVVPVVFIVVLAVVGIGAALKLFRKA